MEFAKTSMQSLFPSFEWESLYSGEIPKYTKPLKYFSKGNDFTRLTFKSSVISKKPLLLPFEKLKLYKGDYESQKISPNAALFVTLKTTDPLFEENFKKLVKQIVITINSIDKDDFEGSKIFKKDAKNTFVEFCKETDINKKLILGKSIIRNSLLKITEVTSDGNTLERAPLECTEEGFKSPSGEIEICFPIKIGKIMGCSKKGIELKYLNNTHNIMKVEDLEKFVQSINRDNNLVKYLSINIDKGVDVYSDKQNRTININLPLFASCISIRRTPEYMGMFRDSSGAASVEEDSDDEFNFEDSKETLVEDLFPLSYLEALLKVIKKKSPNNIAGVFIKGVIQSRTSDAALPVDIDLDEENFEFEEE